MLETKENYKKDQSEKILRLNKNNLFSKILCLEKGLKSVKKNAKFKKRIERHQRQCNDNKPKFGNMEFNVRRKDLCNLSYNENDINDIKKKIKQAKEDWRIT